MSTPEPLRDAQPESIPIAARPATLADAEAITAIYNQGLAERSATFETEPREVEAIRAWFNGRHPIIVGVRQQQVVAFAATSSYRPRACYDGVAEFSVYVQRAARGQGAGRMVMLALIEAAAQAGLWKLVSRVFVENQASRELLRSVGFREVGCYYRHAKLEGAWRDVVIVERLIPGTLD